MGVVIYRISLNKRPGCLFLFWWSRGALNRGRALIWGGALNINTCFELQVIIFDCFERKRKCSRLWRTVPKHQLIQELVFYCTLATISLETRRGVCVCGGGGGGGWALISNNMLKGALNRGGVLIRGRVLIRGNTVCIFGFENVDQHCFQLFFEFLFR